MGTDWITPQALVLFAGALHVLGYLVIHQVALRLLLLAGTAVYILYYFTAADTPLWAAIYMSLAMGLANLVGLASLYWGRSEWAIPARHRDIYDLFRDLPPGDFRELVTLARRVTLDEKATLTKEHAPVPALYFVVSGKLDIEKQGEHFTMPPGVFVGEVAYLTGRPSSATTYLSKGAEMLVWDPAQLRRRSERKARFKLALEAMISKDLALKVAFAVAPHRENWDHSEAVAAAKARPWRKAGTGSRP